MKKYYWTEYDEEILRLNYKDFTNNDLAEYFGVSVTAIEHKLRRLKLRRRPKREYIISQTNEYWKSLYIITDTNNYFISNLGRIKDKNNYEMVSHIDRYGYVGIKLYKSDNLQYDFTIHRLMGYIFLNLNLSSYRAIQINHIDGVKTNNILSNLELMTPSENIKHAHDLNLVNIKKKYSDSEVHAVCKLLQEGKTPDDIYKQHSNMSLKYIKTLKRGDIRKKIVKQYVF